MKIIRIPVLTLVVTLCGCAITAEGPDFSNAPVPAPKDDEAILYIYRQDPGQKSLTANFKIDGKDVVSLPQKGFSWIYVTPGLHTFEYGWPLIARLPTVRYGHVLNSGKIYAFELEYLEFVRMAIEPTDITFAKKEMLTCCKYIQPKETSF